MSLGQQAVVLIRLDAQDGKPVYVSDLTSYMRVDPDTVRLCILELHTKGLAVAIRDKDTQEVIGANARARLHGVRA